LIETAKELLAFGVCPTLSLAKMIYFTWGQEEFTEAEAATLQHCDDFVRIDGGYMANALLDAFHISAEFGEPGISFYLQRLDLDLDLNLVLESVLDLVLILDLLKLR
jgi:hypothetical protein